MKTRKPFIGYTHLMAKERALKMVVKDIANMEKKGNGGRAMKLKKWKLTLDKDIKSIKDGEHIKVG